MKTTLNTTGKSLDYCKLLQKIPQQAEGESRGQCLSLKDLRDLEGRALTELDLEIPEDYLQFLLVRNGLTANGLTLFGSESRGFDEERGSTMPGIIEQNLFKQGSGMPRHLLLLGGGEERLYLFNTRTGHYEVVTMEGGRVEKSYETFAGFIVDLLEEALE